MRENNPVRSVGGRARSVEESSRKVDDPSDVLGVKPESAKETTVIQASNDHEVQERSGKMERPLNGGDKSVVKLNPFPFRHI